MAYMWVVSVNMVYYVQMPVCSDTNTFELGDVISRDLVFHLSTLETVSCDFLYSKLMYVYTAKAGFIF
jgi:hypothetical protein